MAEGLAESVADAALNGPRGSCSRLWVMMRMPLGMDLYRVWDLSGGVLAGFRRQVEDAVADEVRRGRL